MKGISKVRLVRSLLLSAAMLLIAVPAAGASTQVGQLLPPFAAGSCGGNVIVQTTVETGTTSYAVPAGGGVITSWKTQTGALAGTMKLKVVRPTGIANQYFIVGQEGPHNIAANTSPTFSAGVRIPVQAGDLVGMLGTGTNCVSQQTGKTGYHLQVFPMGTDPAVGSTASIESNGSEAAIEMLATVEPDADHDGYGDETQDQCPKDATAQALPCPVPPPPPPAPDTRAPRITLSGKAIQTALKAKAVIGIASADEAVTFKASGSVSVPGAGAFSLVPTSAPGIANAKTELRLAIPKTARKKIKKALREGQKVRASVHVVATDLAGNPSNATQSIAIVNPAKKHHA
jgi:hypothetical protein